MPPSRRAAWPTGRLRSNIAAMNPSRTSRPGLTHVGLVFRSLHRQPLRSTLTVVGVSVGVVAIVALSALVAGIRNSIDAGIRIGGADLAIFEAGVSADILSSLDAEKTRAALRADPDVVAVTAGMSHIMPIEGQRFTVLIGVESDSFTFDPRQVQGGPIQRDDEASLGAVAARRFNKKLGDTIRVGDQDLRIVSIFTSGVIIYDGAVLMHLPAMQRMLGRAGQATALFVDLRPGVDVAAVGRRIEQHNPGLVAIASAAEYNKVDVGLETATAVVSVVTLASIVIGSIIVLNTMWMAVLERTREIGVLRAVGWSRRDVIGTILMESGAVGVAALVLGISLGVALAEILARTPVAGQFLRPAYELRAFVLAGAAAVILSMVGGALPAWRAARVSPAEALRYE